ncbi:DUF1993 domain-containing protein [Phyllobacterium sp. 0TCS1.6C]|uniref:DUF1993 domain-containing protein n=1 Tax=unclassified Phyllobacterium TaxID=2638441 RepID=UPI0022648C23|nr:MULTISPECIES: DUF1993 domain-containing protein [unclassified Phyllobacterium]MCX8280645.1 DUF1993 domain-containing protein [Phyllobacterium sp. 0TCS1.6C]MCX8292778.1 DUF1993 domain-containing protein [Phyllobacterium sp. 0TCS1.6A]
MSLSLYSVAVPALLRGLSIASSLIDKAEHYAAEKKIDPLVLFNARLAPDMLPFSGQVQRMSDTSKNMIGRLTDIAAPSFPDNETNFDELKQRLAKTAAFLESVDEAALADSAAREVMLNFGKMKVALSGQDYVLKFVLPNFYFHVTTAQNILRHNGAPVGKLDYIGSLD